LFSARLKIRDEIVVRTISVFASVAMTGRWHAELTTKERSSIHAPAIKPSATKAEQTEDDGTRDWMSARHRDQCFGTAAAFLEAKATSCTSPGMIGDHEPRHLDRCGSHRDAAKECWQCGYVVACRPSIRQAKGAMRSFRSFKRGFLRSAGPTRDGW